MAEQIISNPQLIINDELIAYTPSSLKYVKNTAKTVIKSLTAGGESAITLHSKDVTEAVSQVTFSFKATTTNIELLDFWVSNTAKNVIELSSSNGVIALAFIGMSIEEVPEMEFGADKDIEVTFKGDSII